MTQQQQPSQPHLPNQSAWVAPAATWRRSSHGQPPSPPRVLVVAKLQAQAIAVEVLADYQVEWTDQMHHQFDFAMEMVAATILALLMPAARVEVGPSRAVQVAVASQRLWKMAHHCQRSAHNSVDSERPHMAPHIAPATLVVAGAASCSLPWVSP